MKRVLIITYYWPPAGGIEVHRVVKFCKYLPALGYEPVVLTVDGSTATASDHKLVEEVSHVTDVCKSPSIEPHHLYYALTGKNKKKPGNPKQEKGPSEPSGKVRALAEFIRLNVFVPDARIGWKPGGVRCGKAFIEEHKPDLIFSTAPPYTVHLIAKKLAKEFALPWVADFRDPWVENYAYNTQYRFPWVRWINERLERSVLNAADRVVVATPGQQELQGAKAKRPEKFHTITNGYDFDTVPADKASEHFFLSYFGSLSAQRVPTALFETFARLITEDADFAAHARFRFAGRITPEARALIEGILPETHSEFLPMLPHAEFWEKVVEHQLLLVLIDQVPHNDMIIPAKCFEMMTTGNPMLAVGPVGGDTDRLFQKQQCGQLTGVEDRAGMKQVLLDQFAAWKQGRLNSGAKAVPEVHRRELSKALAKIFDSL